MHSNTGPPASACGGQEGGISVASSVSSGTDPKQPAPSPEQLQDTAAAPAGEAGNAGSSPAEGTPAGGEHGGTPAGSARKTSPVENTRFDGRRLTSVLLVFLAGAVIGAAVSLGLVMHQRSQEKARIQAAEDLAVWEAQYILPYSDRELLSEEDLEGMDLDELILARDEIAARHGRDFGDSESGLWFAEEPWYTPSDAYSDDVLSETENSNIALISSRIDRLRSGAAAEAYLELLDSYPEPVSGYSSMEMVPAGGIFFWLELNSYEPDTTETRTYMYWDPGSGLQRGLVSPGLLCAKVLDMDRDGMPELMTLTVPENTETYCLDLWTFRDGEAVKAADTVTLYLAAPVGWYYISTVNYLTGQNEDCIAVLSDGGDESGLIYTDACYLTADQPLTLYEGSSGDPGADQSTWQTKWQVNGTDTDRAAYLKTPVPQGTPARWSKSYDNDTGGQLEIFSSRFPYSGWLPASFSLNGPQEIRDARDDLEELSALN